ncbi:SAM-dependent methyltransferase [Hoeflea sp. TYP-13]|uniref:SAM-dependent methyltransferase n=1 Tax=Hoeflea sp. TYP-13 TaxID=3230023 RepID=UPI0034C64F1F
MSEAEIQTPAVVSDASDLAAVIERARACLTDGDVLAAKMLAAAAYDQAKVAQRFAAGEGLIRKAHQLQGDALLIESRAKIRIADEYDAAQTAGEASKGGPRRNVPDGNVFTASEAGLSRKEIFEARKLRDAERGAPGIVERAIAVRLEQGLEPTKASLRHSIGTRTASKEERGNNLYETPPEATHALLTVERFTAHVLEPAVGRGAILRVLEDAGYAVDIADKIDYGTATSDGVVQDVADFLKSTAGEARDIVTNPPYGEAMNAFIAHALRAHRPRKMAMLLNWNAYCGFEDEDRNFWLDEWKPARIWAFSRRLPMMHRDGWDGPRSTSQMNTAWLVWERAIFSDEMPYGDMTVTNRIDWQVQADLPVLEPEGAG